MLGHRDDVPDLLAASDVFAFPSRFEGFPGAIVEAMALALPIVASDIPPHRELIEDGRTGFLFSPENVGALTDCLADILDGSAGEDCGIRAREYFLDHLTLDASTEAMLELYSRLR